MHNQIIKNAAWIIACKIAKSVVSVIITMLSARYLGPSNYGLINYAASIVAFATSLMQLGFNATLVQEIISKPDEEGETLGTALTLSFFSGLACIIGITAFSVISNPGDSVTVMVCVLYSVLLVFQSLEMVQYWFQAKLFSKYTSITMLFAYTLVSVYKIILLIKGANVYWFAVSQALDFAIIDIVLFVLYQRLGTQRIKFSIFRAKQMFNVSKHYILPGMMVTIFSHTDRIMLKSMLDVSAVGVYSSAVTCASMTSFIFTAIIDSTRPVIFSKAKEHCGEVDQAIITLYSIIIYLSLAQSIFITVFAKQIVYILYGEEYIAAIPALRIVAWYTLFSYLGSVRNIWILQCDKQRYLWIINLSGAMANIILNFLLIPLWGVHGAALASLATQIFTNVILGWMIKPIRSNNQLILQGFDFRYLMHILKIR